ncbi:MAG: YARHG domain-containing protein, partial [bacterium]|nr:YARHG domain-containing protein [bacterium]
SSGSSGSGSSSSSSANASDTGVLRTNINSVLAIGGEVVYDSGSGRYIMTFTSGNKRYYAYVSAGSTTAQINGKYMTITAAPTDATYKGSTVFDIKTLTTYEGDYIIKESGTRLLTESDISGFSKDQLALARNEIFARHGRPFSTHKYREYFEQKSWYSINPNYNLDDDKSNLNEIESANVEFLLKHENNM